jgi:chemotaxis signal transduction protein
MMSERNENPTNLDSPDAAGADRGGLHLFSSGHMRFAIFDADVATVAEWRAPTPLPHAPPAVLGVVSIQGRMLTVLDPATLLEASDNGNSTSGFIVALRGDAQLALAASSKSDELLNGAEMVSDGTSAGVLGAIKHREESIPVLDVKHLFALAIRGRERRQRQF